MANLDLFKDCVFVQFSLNENGTPNIPKNGIKEFGLYHNSKYTGESFIGVKGASKYGIRMLKGCTHWGIVDASDPENPVLIHVDTYPSRIPSVAKIRNHYMIARQKGQIHMNLILSDHKSHYDMKRKHES